MPTRAPRTGLQHPLPHCFILLTLLWAGTLFGVDFIATPAKFLSPLASLPVEIDIGRHTFGLFNRVEDLLAALLLSITIALPGVGPGRKALLALPIALFAIKSFWLWPILDIDAIRVVGGLPSTEATLHIVYVGLVACQVVLLAANGVAMLHRAATIA